MKEKIKTILITIKNIVCIAFGSFLILGAVAMISEDITATIICGIIGLLLIFSGKELITKGYEESHIEKEEQEESKSKQFEEEIKLKQQEYNNEIKRIEMEIAYEKKIKELNSVLREYKLIPPTETEIRVTIDKIQEIYKELGFIVKVIDIRKERYATEYKVVFDKNITHYQILSLEKSLKLKEEFSIDGISIKAEKGKKNHLIISVPYEYKN